MREERERKTADPQLEPIEGTKRKSPKRKEKKKNSIWYQRSKGKETFLVGAGPAVSKAAEIANEIWAETSLLVTHKSNFCEVVKAKTRLKKAEA